MVKTARPNRSLVAQPALHLIGHRKSAQEVLAAGPGIFACRKDRSDIVAGVAGFMPGNIAVVEIEVSDEGRVVKGRAIRGGAPAADQAAVPGAAEIFELIPHQFDRLASKRPYGAAQAVQYSGPAC